MSPTKNLERQRWSPGPSEFIEQFAFPATPHPPLYIMMMTASPTNNLLQSPKLSSAMNSLSVKRPSLSPLKRKLSDDAETPSPTSMDEVPEESVISPVKKAKLSDKTTNTSTTPTSATWSCALALDDDEPMDDGSDEACAKVLSAYTPTAFEDEPATPLDEEELEILEYFLA